MNEDKLPKTELQANEQKKTLDPRRLSAWCTKDVGPFDRAFLCQSLGILNPAAPLMIAESRPISEVLEVLQQHKIGCVVVVGEEGKLAGIFSERDFLLKIAHQYEQVKSRAIRDFMTKDPVCERMQASIAYALNLMSHGGFRHLPIVDDEMHPVGIISVKDLIDKMVEKLTDDLLNLEVEL